MVYCDRASLFMIFVFFFFFLPREYQRAGAIFLVSMLPPSAYCSKVVLGNSTSQVNRSGAFRALKFCEKSTNNCPSFGSSLQNLSWVFSAEGRLLWFKIRLLAWSTPWQFFLLFTSLIIGKIVRFVFFFLLWNGMRCVAWKSPNQIVTPVVG